jgi:hypothetical protein
MSQFSKYLEIVQEEKDYSYNEIKLNLFNKKEEVPEKYKNLTYADILNTIFSGYPKRLNALGNLLKKEDSITISFEEKSGTSKPENIDDYAFVVKTIFEFNKSSRVKPVTLLYNNKEVDENTLKSIMEDFNVGRKSNKLHQGTLIAIKLKITKGDLISFLKSTTPEGKKAYELFSNDKFITNYFDLKDFLK